MSSQEMADFLQLSQLSEPRGLGEVEAYDRQYKHVLKAILEEALRLLEAAGSLSVPLGRRIREEGEAARQGVQEAASLVEAARPLHILLRPLSSEAAGRAALNLPGYDFAPLAGAAALGAAASRLCLVLEAEEPKRGLELMKRVRSLAAEFASRWRWRTPENLTVSEAEMFDLFSRDFGSSLDLDVGFKLSSLRRWRRSAKQRYLRNLVKLVHAAIEEVRGSGVEVSLPEFHARLSDVALFLDVGMNDLMVCLADLKNRGWVEGMTERRGRQLLLLRQPDVEHLVTSLKESLGDAAVTTEGAVEAQGWDYFTALHVIKQLERRGELKPDEDGGGCTWRWVEAP